MFESFYDRVVSELKSFPAVQQLSEKFDEGLDTHIANTLLERGQRCCDSRLLGFLYAYRYSPMHYAALCKVIPDEKFDTMVDFGGGPGTAMLALAASHNSTFERISLEHASGMREVSELAHQITQSRCKMNSENQMPGQQFWRNVETQTHAKRVLVIFSYFFAQDLTLPFVRALANRIALLRATGVTILYTNPVGPAASWMPNGGVHDWYREFSSALGHTPKISQTAYTYQTLRNLCEPVSRSGDCAYEVWRLK